MAPRLRRLLACLVGAALALVAVQGLGFAAASARAAEPTFEISGQSSCVADGSRRIAWLVSNTTVSTVMAAVTDHAPTAATIASTPFMLQARGTLGATAALIETGVPGDATEARITVSLNGDRGTSTVGTLVLPDAAGDCRLAQSISFASAAPGAAMAGGPDYTPVVTGGSSSAATVITADPGATGCEVTAGVVRFLGAGTCILHADRDGDSAHLAAPRVTQTFPVAAGVVTITDAELPVAIVGEPYAVQLHASGGIAPYHWSAADLPAGLVVDAATGLLHGVPAATGSTPITISATDSEDPVTGTLVLTLTTRAAASAPAARGLAATGLDGSAIAAALALAAGAIAGGALLIARRRATG